MARVFRGHKAEENLGERGNSTDTRRRYACSWGELEQQGHDCLLIRDSLISPANFGSGSRLATADSSCCRRGPPPRPRGLALQQGTPSRGLNKHLYFSIPAGS